MLSRQLDESINEDNSGCNDCPTASQQASKSSSSSSVSLPLETNAPCVSSSVSVARLNASESDFLLPESAGPNFSFAGCGFMGVYHVGVCSCLKEYAPQLYTNRVLAGASAGALAACCLMCDCDLGQCANFVLSLVDRASVRTLGPFHPSFSITSLLKSGLEDILPMDAHRICSGRLFVSVTDVLTLRNRVISDFPSRDYLIQALMCSAHIPGFSGLTFPELNGVRLMDGCFSCNLPRLNAQTVLVSPFAGLADISPEDEVWFMMPQPSSIDMDITLANWKRLVRVLWPPGPDKLAQICQRGFDDCVDYLVRHSHVRLSASLEYELGNSAAAASTGEDRDGYDDDYKVHELVSATTPHSFRAQLRKEGLVTCRAIYDFEDQPPRHSDDEKVRADVHTLCELALEMRSVLAEGIQNSLPPSVLEALQRAQQKTLLRRLYDSQMVRVVRLLIQPYTLPIDVLYLLCKRLLRYLPLLPEVANAALGETRQHLRNFTETVRLRRAQSSAFLDRFRHRVIGGRPSATRNASASAEAASTADDCEAGQTDSTGSPRWHQHRPRCRLSNRWPNRTHQSAGELRELLTDELDYRPGEEEAHDTIDQALLVHQQRANRLVRFYLYEEPEQEDDSSDLNAEAPSLE